MVQPDLCGEDRLEGPALELAFDRHGQPSVEDGLGIAAQRHVPWTIGIFADDDQHEIRPRDPVAERGG